MRTVFRYLAWLTAGVLAAIVGVVAWLLSNPPELLRIGTGYAAKIVCSNVFVAGRDAGSVLAVDVQAPGNPLLRLVSVDVDRRDRHVEARFLGYIAPSIAIHREGLGCTNVADMDIEKARAVRLQDPPPPAAPRSGPWPSGDEVGETDPRLAPILADADLTGPGVRAVVVVKDGRIVGETYGAGFGPDTPLIGWSMTKTVNAMILGRLLAEGRLSLDESGLFEDWRGDDRAAITIRSLLAMESGLEFNEDYGDVTDVTRMLFLSPDMAAFAADKRQLEPPGRVFNYSTGTSVLLSRVWMDHFDDDAAALAYPRSALFGPLGMTSAVLEADESGTLSGSSYMYAAARDWARLAFFLLRDGVWNGERLLPDGFVAAMRRPTRVSEGAYTEMQAWHVGPGGEANGIFGLPDDMFWLQGHDGQTTAIFPDKGLAIVRLGLTPAHLDYRPQRLAKAVLDALK
ncbi:beta-lactamase family protein [Pseudomonas sp. R2.Fl]|nr:beta-lactamase family protein [Pseudomonas sp. R2.Fl]